MKNRKPPTEREAGEWLRQGRIALPPFRLRLQRIPPPSGKWDFEIEGTWAGQKARFAAEYKSQTGCLFRG